MQRQLTLGLLFSLGFHASAWAQISTGSITGTVTDPTAAVVEGAKVSVINRATGVQTTLETNASGIYKAPFLQPGIYRVRVEKAGFGARESTGVTVQVSNETVVNVTLEVGAVDQTLTVEEAAGVVQTDSAQLSTDVDNKTIVSLPLQSTGADRMVFLSPGVVVGFGNINSNGATFAANGQRARSNNFLLDGQDNNDNSIGGPGYFFTNLDAIGEFSVITNQFSAEYGRNAGAIVNIRVREGTNTFHANGHYLRRDDQNWTALTNRQRATGRTNPPKYLDTNLGGQFEGPIIRNKLFFMTWVEREWVRQDGLSIGTPSALTPTPAGLQTLQAAFPNATTVQNLVKYGPWGSGKIGAASIVPGTITTQSLKRPDGTTVDVEFSAVQRAYPVTQDNWDSGIKVDYHIGAKDYVSGKLYDQNNTYANNASNGPAAQAGYFYDNPGRSKQPGGSWVHTFSPALVNELRFSFIKTGFFFEGGNTFPFSEIQKNIANVSITGGYLGYGLATNLPQYRLVNSYQVQDNVTKQWGRHSLKMGVQIIKDNIPLGFLPFINGQYVYQNFQAYVDNTPTSYNGAAGKSTQEPTETDQAYYLQDDFKLRRNLTLNLGIRYEYTGQPINLLNRYTVERESNPATAIWDPSLPLSARTYPELPADTKNWAPRLGFAWTPSSQGGILGHDDTVVRGGFAISYDPAFYNLMLNAQTAAPVVFTYTLSGASVKPMQSDISGAALAQALSPPKGVDPRTFNQTLFSGNFHHPYSLSFSFGVQRRVGNNMGFEIRYVRTRGIGQFATRNGNPFINGFLNNGFANVVPSGLTPTTSANCANCNGRIVPNYSNIRIRDNSASSTYDGLQTRYDIRNLARQLTLGASYTFSKTIDNVSEVFDFSTGINSAGSIVLPQNPFDVGKSERGLSNNHVPHALGLDATWDIPGWRNSSKWYARVVGGWSLGVFEVWQAGRPMTVYQGICCNAISDTATNNFIQGYDTARPFLANPNAPLQSVGFFTPNGALVSYTNRSRAVQFSDVHWIYNNLDADKALRNPFGVSRNSATSPRYQRADISLFKTFGVTERLKFSLRMDARNIFNHVAYPLPNLQIDSGTSTTFLDPTWGDLSATNSNRVPRIIQLGARISF